MTDPRAELHDALTKAQRDRAAHDDALRETRALLERADRRLRESGTDRRRWEATVDSLEQALADGKRRLTGCDLLIVDLRKQLESIDDTDEPHPAPPPAPQPAVQTPADAIDRAAQLEDCARKVMEVPSFMLRSLPKETLGLARAFAETPEFGGWTRADRDELQRRFRIVDRAPAEPAIGRRSTPARAPVSLGSIRYRTVLEKCSAGRLADLTIAELDILASCIEAIASRAEPPDPSDPMAELLLQAIDRIGPSFDALDGARERLMRRWAEER